MKKWMRILTVGVLLMAVCWIRIPGVANIQAAEQNKKVSSAKEQTTTEKKTTEEKTTEEKTTEKTEENLSEAVLSSKTTLEPDEVLEPVEAPKGLTFDDLPASYVIEDVPHIYQNVKYPTGCESVSTVVAMQYAGYEITPEEFIDNYLPLAALHTDEKGRVVGPGLDDGFLGDPYTNNGYGCYPGALIKAYLKMGIRDQYEMLDVSANTMAELCKQYILNDIPVIFWATCGMSCYTASESWIDEKTGETVTFYKGEHCLVLIGYDEGGYYFSDSLRTEDVVYYEKSLVEKSHALLDNRAAVFMERPYPLQLERTNTDEWQGETPALRDGTEVTDKKGQSNSDKKTN